MSDEVNNSNPQAQQVTPNITGEEAKALVEKAKVEGKPVHELIASKNAPQTQSNQEQIKEAAKEAIRKHKLKIDGQEIEVDEDELKRGYSHQKAANKILQEGKAARKQATEFLEMMKDKTKLVEVLQKLGHDPKQLSTELLGSILEDEYMDPRDKELRDTKKKLKAIEDMERQQRDAVEKQRLDEMKAKFAKDYETQFIDELKKNQIPGTKPMIAEMAKYIGRAAKIGFKMTPSEAAQLVKEDIQTAQMSLIGNADGETLLKLLGDDVASKLLTARGSKIKNPEQNLKTPQEQGEPNRVRTSSNKRMSASEWRAFNKK